MDRRYVVYVTFYRGNKMPPFYIGYVGEWRLQKGYHGSVSSRTFKTTWKKELADNPHLFKTVVISRFETKREAMLREEHFHQTLKVVKNPLYLNMATASGEFGFQGPHTEETKEKIKASERGKVVSEESRDRMRRAKRGKKRRPHSEATKHKMSISKLGDKNPNFGKPISKEVRLKIGASHSGENHWSFGVPRPLETRQKISVAKIGQVPWNKGKSMSEAQKQKLRKPKRKVDRDGFDAQGNSGSS